MIGLAMCLPHRCAQSHHAGWSHLIFSFTVTPNTVLRRYQRADVVAHAFAKSASFTFLFAIPLRAQLLGPLRMSLPVPLGLLPCVSVHSHSG